MSGGPRRHHPTDAAPPARRGGTSNPSLGPGALHRLLALRSLPLALGTLILFEDFIHA